MGKVDFSLRYGKGSVAFSIPEEQLLCVIEGKDYPGLPDVPSAVKHALEHPIDAPPLREIVKPNDKVAIAVSDITRVWQKMSLTLPVILDTLNAAGVPDQNITILIAVGGHRGNTQEEFAEICGQDVCRRVKVVNHDATDYDNMVYLGKTSFGTEVSVNRIVAEADKVILTGGIIYHYMVGYGGGRKSVLPGVASLKTIQQNHLHAMSYEVGGGSNRKSVSRVLEGNNTHHDMMEIAAFVNPDFIVNVVPNPAGEIAGVFAGNWVSAWQKGTQLVDKIYGVEIEAKADIVISTCGGYPKDINLYQTGKTMDNAFYAVKEGGVVIILSECQDIMEPLEFTQWFNHDTILDMELALRKNFTIPGWVAFKEVECAVNGTYILVTKPENFDLVRKAKLIPIATIGDALEIAYQKCGTAQPKITVMPHGANTLPILKS
ncbi:MAG: nickel-dependent lactate racemase [Bacillota bacterium]